MFAISITPPGMVASTAVLASTFTSRIRISAPTTATATEITAPSTISGNSVTIVTMIAGVKVVPTAAPVTNCPAARACHSERTGTLASPSAAVIISAPVIHGNGKCRYFAIKPPANATANVASKAPVVRAMSLKRVGVVARGASAAGASLTSVFAGI
jgi:hypothetical protein